VALTIKIPFAFFSMGSVRIYNRSKLKAIYRRYLTRPLYKPAP
jgi:hypothetical protein